MALTCSICGNASQVCNCSIGEPIGCAIAQRLTTALCLNGIPYQTLADIIYKELREIVEEQEKGDWLELPGGFVYTKE